MLVSIYYRYIKDELAHIKRQRTMSSNFSPYSVSHLLNSQSTSGMDPSAAAKAVQRAYNNSINVSTGEPHSSDYVDSLATDYEDMNSYRPPPITSKIDEDDERESVKSSSKSSLLSFMFKNSANQNVTSNSDNQSISSTTSAPVPFWRKSFQADPGPPSDYSTVSGGDALHRGPSRENLQQLAQTPQSTSYMEQAGQNQNHNSGGEGIAVAGGMRDPGRGQWRDKYVMKFNEWDSTKPDDNLPPSSTRATHSPFHSQQTPSSSSSSSSSQHRATISHSSGGSYAPSMIDDKSNEGAHGGVPSFEDSKEVFAHGKVLHPRSAYELDLMSSSRSHDQRKHPQEFPRKRTNSL
jgi:hypothetical protein